MEDGTGIQDWAEGAWELSTAVSPRLRPALGECLARLAAAMPVAFLEPQLNEYNACSVYTTKSPRERASKWGWGWGDWQGLSSTHMGPKETHCEGSGVQSGPGGVEDSPACGCFRLGNPRVYGDSSLWYGH